MTYVSSDSSINQSQAKGLFIVVEGIEGGGKSTNIAFIKQWLEQKKISVVTTREPGGTPYAEKIRQLLLTTQNEDNEVVHDDTELLLVFAARAQHIAQVIKPALAKGLCVLSDRFTDATYAYQGGGRGLSQQKIAILENLVQENLRPDCVIILDIPVELSMKRVNQRLDLNETKDRFEQEQCTFFEKVRHTYLARANQFPACYRVVDASQTLTKVQADIAQILEDIYQIYNRTTSE